MADWIKIISRLSAASPSQQSFTRGSLRIFSQEFLIVFISSDPVTVGAQVMQTTHNTEPKT